MNFDYATTIELRWNHRTDDGIRVDDYRDGTDWDNSYPGVTFVPRVGDHIMHWADTQTWETRPVLRITVMMPQFGAMTPTLQIFVDLGAAL